MGQQWWAMGRGLFQSEKVFTAKIHEISDLFALLDDEWSLIDILTADETSSQINKTEYAQPAIFSIQIALATLWESIGVCPDIVVGHSIGEVTAAHISGALSLEDAVSVCFHRSRLQARLKGRGSMLAVGLSSSEIESRIQGLQDRVSIAAINSLNSITLAGEITELKRLETEFESENIFARMLNVEVPYHSSVMDEIADAFEASLQGISPTQTNVQLVSTVTGEVIDGSALGADYWVRNIRQPVEFAHAIRGLIKNRDQLFIEIGAHPVLATSIAECLAAQDRSAPVVASLRRNLDDNSTFRAAVSQLYCHGINLVFERLFEAPTAWIKLPTYPWQRTSFWTESGESRNSRTGVTVQGGQPDHLLLGSIQSAPNPVWLSEIALEQPTYLQHHRVQGSVVFPAAGYVEMALAAARLLGAVSGTITLEKLKIEAPLVLAKDAQVKLQFSQHGTQLFEIHSRTGKQGDYIWTRHAIGDLADGQFETVREALDLNSIRMSLEDKCEKPEFYAALDSIGLNYGAQFQNIETAWLGHGEVLGRITVTTEIHNEIDKYVLHPAILDAAFQLLAIMPNDRTYLPVAIERFELLKTQVVPTWAFGKVVSQSEKLIVADISLTDDGGNLLAQVSGLVCQHFEDAGHAAAGLKNTYLYDRAWITLPLDEKEDGVRPAAHMPLPIDIVPVLQERHNRRSVENGHQEFIQKAWPALDTLALSYVVEALTKLGWNWQRETEFTLDQIIQELGISSRHMRFVERMLQLLAQSKCIAGKDGRWTHCAFEREMPANEQYRELVLAHPNCHAELALIRRCGMPLEKFLRDEEEPLAALFPVGSPIADHLYADAPTFRPYNQIISDAIVKIVQQLPEARTIRILEVGGGTGGLTAHVLPLLPEARTEYVFTDISQSFLNHAKQKFKAFPFMSYEIFDVENDLIEQGFHPNSFDLIVVFDTVHATTDLRFTLKNLNNLLVPGGLLALLEMTTPPLWCDLVFGLLPGWWLFGDRDLRPDHATLPASGWLSILDQCGYETSMSVCDQIAGSESLHSVILSRKSGKLINNLVSAESQCQDRVALPPETTFILLPDNLGVATSLADKLRAMHCVVLLCDTETPHDSEAFSFQEVLDGASPEHSELTPIIIDLRYLCCPVQQQGNPSPSAAITTACLNLQEIVDILGAKRWQGRPGLWVVTNGTEQIGNVGDVLLGQGAVRGFARVLINEHGDLDIRLVDLSSAPVDAEIDALAQEILAGHDEVEIVLRDDRRLVNRVVAHTSLKEADGRKTSYVQRVKKRSPPADIAFYEKDTTAPAPGEVQLRVYAAGLNFKDFAQLSGLIEFVSDGLGLEGAGIVVAVGEGVTEFAPGDAVMGLIDCSMSNPVNTDARLLMHKPSNLSFDDAAGMCVTYLSAYQALKKQARLSEDETVLIHTGASGVGLAAIQVARAQGAMVLATAGNAEKRTYLQA
ncbi:MAG: acyltransferase domain-containing protein, partial [Fimbriimonadaceae bacterium]|nr:acyltransferase domain-containing protein [Alphaproteobacteria bacterium]